ncbi:MAG: class I SAM-dependent methyltransferase [Deltaproteobacteria bacterium]|nr:class I SAM-dependent methyltransferase [Deltaproteobacteria bacterium]
MTEELQRRVHQFVDYRVTGDPESDYHVVAGALSGILAGVRALEKEGLARPAIKQLVAGAYEAVGRSVLFRRMQIWPRGYPGDFETIEHIMSGDNRSEVDAKAYFIEQYGLASPAAQQHRNKVSHQARMILQTALTRAPARILSIACGSSPDIRAVLPHLRGSQVEFVLLDGDQGALDFTRAQLEGAELPCEFIHGNILKNIVRLRDFGQFDLVVIGGLFDYLRDTTIVKILSSLRAHNLRKQGRVFFTNISEHNPDRVFIEYLAEWCLIARTEERMRSLAQLAGFGSDAIAIQREATKLTHLVECTA